MSFSDISFFIILEDLIRQTLVMQIYQTVEDSYVVSLLKNNVATLTVSTSSHRRDWCHEGFYWLKIKFDGMSYRDTVAWNSMLAGYSQLGLHQEALSLFHQMRISNAKPDPFTFTAALSACADSGSLLNGTKVHALVIVSGYQSSLAVNNSLIDMYGKCLNAFSAGEVFQAMDDTNEVTWCSLLFAYANSGQFNAAREIFNLMPRKVDIAWNTMIAGLGRCGEIELCLDMFKKMLQSLCEPDQWTYSALISACTESSELLCGCVLHSVIIKSGWSSAVEAKNSILSLYAKLGSLSDAMKIFESTGILTQVSWNAIIDAHMKAHELISLIRRTHDRLL